MPSQAGAYDAYLDGVVTLKNYEADKRRFESEIEKAQAERGKVEAKLQTCQV